MHIRRSIFPARAVAALLLLLLLSTRVGLAQQVGHYTGAVLLLRAVAARGGNGYCQGHSRCQMRLIPLQRRAICVRLPLLLTRLFLLRRRQPRRVRQRLGKARKAGSDIKEDFISRPVSAPPRVPCQGRVLRLLGQAVEAGGGVAEAICRRCALYW